MFNKYRFSNADNISDPAKVQPLKRKNNRAADRLAEPSTSQNDEEANKLIMEDIVGNNRADEGRRDSLADDKRR